MDSRAATALRTLVVLGLAMSLLAAKPAPKPTVTAAPVTTVLDGGSPANRVDIAVLGDGYTSAELAKYHADANAIVASFFAEAPYSEYQPYFNVHLADVVSQQSGADHPERSPAVYVDTAFDAAYNCGGTARLICANDEKVRAVLEATFAPVQRDIVLLVVNDAQYGGSGGWYAIASTHDLAGFLALHETGHSFGLLGDEYGGQASCTTEPEPIAPNLTKQTDRNLIKWRHWISDTTPVPTTSTESDVPGLYEGGKYCQTDMRRPTYDSIMKTTTATSWGQINREQLVKRIYNFVSPLDAADPTAPSVTVSANTTQTFRVTPMKPATGTLDVTWHLDGTAVGTGNEVTIESSRLPAGTVVEARLRDRTPWVIHDPEALLHESRQWTIVEPAPYTAVNDSATVGKRAVKVSIPVLNNDDSGSSSADLQSVAVVGAPSLGTASPDANGSILYDFTGTKRPATDSFTYKACNLDGSCGQATVSVTINR